MKLILTLLRNKCIGCNYCVESAPDLFRMSRKDGKAILLNAYEKRGFYTLKLDNPLFFPQAERAEEVCPAKIIQVKRL